MKRNTTNFGAKAENNYFSLKRIFPSGKCSPVIPNYELMVAAFAGGEITRYKIHDDQGDVVEVISAFDLDEAWGGGPVPPVDVADHRIHPNAKMIQQLAYEEDRSPEHLQQPGLGGDMRPFEVWIYTGDIPLPPDADPSQCIPQSP